MSARGWGLVAVGAVALSCVGLASNEDSGTDADSSLHDAGRVDSGNDASIDEVDAGRLADAGEVDAGQPGDASLPPLQECSTPSIDRLTDWSAPEGVLETASGVRWTLLVRDGGVGPFVARVHFQGNDWHAALVLLTNANSAAPRAEAIVDATSLMEMIVTYSSSSNVWVQLRSYDSFGGPNLFAAAMPSTAGQKRTLHLSLDPALTPWKSLFQTPTLSYSETRAQLKAVTFVGDADNDLTFYGLRLPPYSPVCP